MAPGSTQADQTETGGRQPWSGRIMVKRWRRVLLVALFFVVTSVIHILSIGGGGLARDVDLEFPDPSVVAAASMRAPRPRLEYVRPPGGAFELRGIFMELSDPAEFWRRPSTPRQIAHRYGLPETPRDVACDPEGEEATTVGWIPSVRSASNSSLPFGMQGKIPRAIWQSWKTNQLKGRMCRIILEWSQKNPEYDYFLFDDDAVDEMIRLEYGDEIFSSFACVKVGAAKCDIWRLMVMYMFGGVYFDADVRLLVPLKEWDWGERDVVTAKSCTRAKKKHYGGCAHQWGLIYTPRHPVLHAAITNTLHNLAARTARSVYDVAFNAFYYAWRNGPYNQSYMPGWGEDMDGKVLFSDIKAKKDMVEDNGHWPDATPRDIWHDKCLSNH